MGILIVDDSPDSQNLLKKLLENAGYTDLLTAGTAPEAFNRLGLDNPLQPGLKNGLAGQWPSHNLRIL